MSRVSNWTITRRLIPFTLLRYVLFPLCAYLILLGWGKSTAREFWAMNT